jgi:hypothetical protein
MARPLTEQDVQRMLAAHEQKIRALLAEALKAEVKPSASTAPYTDIIAAFERLLALNGSRSFEVRASALQQLVKEMRDGVQE